MRTDSCTKSYPIPFDGICRPINGGFFNRFAIAALVKLLRPFRKHSGRTLILNDKICIKYSRFISLSEATTLKFIADGTDVPVPKVYCSFVLGSTTYIVMERIHGKMLAAVWTSLSESSRTKILLQLKSIVQLLRDLEPPKDFKGVANVAGGPLYDSRLPQTEKGFGPFQTIQEFHKFLRNGLEKLPDLDDEIAHMIGLHDGPWPNPVFTHGDLSSLNIIVDEDSNIRGIIDWETAGWYPHYWEYATAHQVNAYNLFWKDQIDNFLQPMPDELAMDQTRNKYFGDVG